jgi:hypothetical protein
MAYKISINEECKQIELQYSEPTEISEHFEGRDKVIELCRENKFNKVLVNLGNTLAQNTISKGDLLSFGQSWDKELFSNIILAIVMPENRKSQDEYYFPLAIMKHKGISAKSFYKEEDAISWLAKY